MSDAAITNRANSRWGLVYDGAAAVLQRTPSTFKPLAAINTNAEITAWTPTSGKKFRLMGGTIAVSVTGNVTIKDNTGGTTIAIFPGIANTPFTFSMGNGILSAAANNVLTMTGPGGSTVSGTIFGTEE